MRVYVHGWVLAITMVGCAVSPEDPAAVSEVGSELVQTQKTYYQKVFEGTSCESVVENGPGEHGRVRVRPVGSTSSWTTFFDGCGTTGTRFFDNSCTEAGRLQITAIDCGYGCDSILGCIRPTVYVQEFGAVCDGSTDDGPAFQAALNHAESLGGGEVVLPAGTCFVDRTLSIGDNTTVSGQGSDTVVMRGPTYSYGPLWGGAGNCEKNIGIKSWILFMNKGYNCGNTGIELRDFHIDGSLVPWIPGITIAFSAIRNTHVHNLGLHNVPQDGIFFRNGGVNTSIRNNTIFGFHHVWGNSGAITIEMHPNGNYPTPASTPVRIEGNLVMAQGGPTYCTQTMQQQCTSDADCPSLPGNFCGRGVTAINARWTSFNAPGTREPHVRIVDNHIVATDMHQGITCIACSHSVIEGNVLEPGQSETLLSGLYTGISAGGDNLVIRDNTILGSGFPGDGHGIVVDGGSALLLDGNRVENRRAALSATQISVRGTVNFVVRDNEVLDGAGGHGLFIGMGSCASQVLTGPGIVENNSIHMPANAGTAYKPLVLRRTTGVVLDSNLLTPAIAPSTC